MNNFKEDSLCALLLKKEKESGQKIYLRQPRQGKWHEFTWADVVKKARQVAAFLEQGGYKRGDHIAIISKNCAEWFITDFGIALAGMVTIPLFSNQHKDSIEYILEHGEVKLVFIGKLDDHNRIRDSIPSSYPSVGFDYHEDLKVDHSWREILDCKPLTTLKLPIAEDLYTIIYSSGTSGQPKGAMYTHQTIANYLSIFPQDLKRISDQPQYRLISYLPLAHVYERTAIELASLTIPAEVSFVESLEKFADNLQAVQPTLFAAVPRIWGVFQQKIEQKISPGLLSILIHVPLVSGFLKKKIRRQLGLAECSNCFSGASHLPISVLHFFDKLGIFIQEGYGQTENLAYATLSLLKERREGYVGSPRLEVEIKRDDKNEELLIRSHCLMTGYYKEKKATEAAFTKEGWLRTGDIVEIDRPQRVKITGRLSEIFKNQKGEFVAPSSIEKRFYENEMIEHLCLIGQELPNNILLVNLTEAARKKPEQEVKELLKHDLHRVNADLKSYEKISHLLLVKEKWTIENDMLTPTLKVKRRVVESRYGETIKSAIKKKQTVIWL